MKVPSVRRRSVLQGLGTGSVAAVLGGAEAMAAPDGRGMPAKAHDAMDAQVETSFISFDDPIEEFKAHFRFERDLVPEQGTTLTWYFWLAYIVAENERPRPVLRYEGMEYSYFRKVADHTYRIHAHNLSYTRDLQTNKYTDTVLNPITGKTVKTANTVLLNDPGTVHSPRGFRNMNGDGTYVQPYRQFRRENDIVKFDSVRTAPPNWPAMHLESSIQWADYADYKNPAVTSLPARSTAIYLFPFPKWLEMEGKQGHMLGYIDARKIHRPSQLPREFLDRTQKEYPELLSPRWGEFDRPPTFTY